MKRAALLAILAVGIVAACEPDPAKSIKITDKGAAPPPAQAILAPWQVSNCNLEPESEPGKSTFVSAGPCSFKHTGTAKCRSLIDDMYALFLRNSATVGTVSLYVNTEGYKGPGEYKDAQVSLTYQNGNSYYHWGSDSVHLTVTPGEKTVILGENTLQPEAPNKGTVVVSGELTCKKWSGPTITETPNSSGN
ncbi:MAG TPA: hypothetical protein VM166_13975 [Gemmatimonadaceae bacterium]|nr:hypothetical protein [Gemmatimonadaceae bacterium]